MPAQPRRFRSEADGQVVPLGDRRNVEAVARSKISVGEKSCAMLAISHTHFRRHSRESGNRVASRPRRLPRTPAFAGATHVNLESARPTSMWR